MSDTVLNDIADINGINSLFENKLIEYRNIILKLIDDFCFGKMDFDGVVTQWGDYLRHVNVFIINDESLRGKVQYPYSKYELKTMALERKYELYQLNGIEFDLLSSVSAICGGEERALE